MSKRDRLPDDWEQIVQRCLGSWPLLTRVEQARLGELAGDLISMVRWEAARGFTLTDEIVVTIAAQASVLVLGLDVGYFRNATSVIVHPTTFSIPGPRPGPVPGLVDEGIHVLNGEAHHERGPILLAWDQARYGARHRGRGGNVVLHEFAHKIDMLDGVVDGTPPLPDQAALDRWITVCTAELDELRAGDGESLLGDYAATDPGEFFAVSTEVFFDQPVELRESKPDLYGVLSDFYRQDPAARSRLQQHE
jgi:Mlc titration factor MtfA (ptsG expression regulator)